VGAQAAEDGVNDFMRRLLFLPEQASTVARGIDYLHYFVITVTMIGAAAVALASLYYIVRYRQRPGQRLTPRGRPVSVVVEAGVFGGLLAMFVAWWMIGFGQYVRIADAPPDSMTIYVVAKQWMWSFAYPQGGGSNGVLYVPTGRPVRLVMTSRDVIHSFYVPDFRLKMDVVPGRSTTMWFQVDTPGRHPVYCAEMCGVGHSMMHAEVVALAAADYDRALHGLAPVTPEAGSLAAMGERVAAQSGCLRCHTVDGTPHIGPTWAGLYDSPVPLADGTTVVADEAYLTSSMMDPAAQLHRGFAAVMPSYQGLLDAAQVGALVEYIRSLRDVARYGGAEPLPARTDVPIVHPLEERPR
jgi:cytochrome c oxidase subunit II